MAYLDPDKALFMLNRSGKDILGPFAWVPYGDNVYILDCMRGYVVVEPLKTLLPFRVGGKVILFSPHWSCSSNPFTVGLTFTATHRIPFKGDKSIVRPGLPLLDALVRSEQYIQRRVLSPSQSRCLLRSADWRNRTASLGQVRFVREMLASAKGRLAEIGLEGSELTDDVLSTMTMGEISTIITRLKYSTLRVSQLSQWKDFMGIAKRLWMLRSVVGRMQVRAPKLHGMAASLIPRIVMLLARSFTSFCFHRSLE